MACGVWRRDGRGIDVGRRPGRAGRRAVMFCSPRAANSAVQRLALALVGWWAFLIYLILDVIFFWIYMYVAIAFNILLVLEDLLTINDNTMDRCYWRYLLVYVFGGM